MAAGVEANILTALCAHLATLVTNPALPVAWPGIAFDSPPDNYLRVTPLINETVSLVLGNGANKHRGIFQVSVLWKSRSGLIAPLEVADLIAAHFAKGTTLYSGTVRVVIYRKPSAASPLQEDDRVQVPVSIPYHSFNE